MPTDEELDYGIKYKKITINQTTFLLIPLELIEGQSIGGSFYGKTQYNILDSPETIVISDIIVSSINSVKELQEIYEIDDKAFLKGYIINDEMNKILLVRIHDNKLFKKKIDLNSLLNKSSIEVYEEQREKPAVTLNNDALEILLEQNLDEIRTQLLMYKEQIAKFRDHQQKEGVSRIIVENGHVKNIETKARVVNEISSPKVDNSTLNKEIVASGNTLSQTGGIAAKSISLKGLESYIKERIFGHDKEIKYLAKTIMMNYTAAPNEKNEPILIVGPTGTGKTETMNAVCEYLDIPMIEINTINLVPEGIKGMSLEDCLYQLYSLSHNNLETAKKGLMFFDEFDKLGKISSDSTKSPVIQILLKFIEGCIFSLNEKYSDDIIFPTKNIIKVFAGAFSELWDSKAIIGFGASTKISQFNPKLITEKEYFGKEAVSRIPHIFVYEELSREDKKRYLLESKISELTLKRERYARQFNVDLIADESYIEALLDKLAASDRSMRDLNNLIISSLNEVECELLDSSSSYKKLILTAETVEDNTKFKLI